jgi:release factor glutamine methyltransferase
MEELYQSLKKEFEQNLSILEDKPEETVESTIKALWNKAFGISVSAEKSLQLPLPEISELQQTTLLQLAQKRIEGTPLAHLTGRQSFMGVDLICDKRALIPRKETEILGKAALEICQSLTTNESDITIMDLCCGSGNLGLAIASMVPRAKVFSSDLSHEAVELTQENIDFLNLNDRVQVAQSDLFGSFDSNEFWNQLDMIICNPPYISSSKVQKMNSEIARNEPSLAFDGGMVGLRIIQNLIKESPKFMKDNGWLVFEVGLGQGPFVIQLCEKNGAYSDITPAYDQSGNIRVIAVCKIKGQESGI